MQTYSLATIVFGVVQLFIVSYIMQPPVNNLPRVVTIDNAKPQLLVEEDEISTTLSVSDLENTLTAQEPEIVVLDGATPAELVADLSLAQDLSLSTSALDPTTVFGFALDDTTSPSLTGPPIPEVQILPTEFDLLAPEVDLLSATNISSIEFSSRIDEFELVALNPERLFGEGFFTIYATFEYNAMADGMVWSWVWRRDGQIVSGGNEVWVYGEEGPGYVYFNPTEGFQLGQYTLEIWVNGELMNQSNLFITDDIAASQ